MATVEIFRNSFVEALRGSLPDNLDRYREDDPWVLELPGYRSRQLATGLPLRGELELILPNAGHNDIENAIRLHRVMPQLTPLQARDPRLWVRFAHVELWPYMRARWPVERYVADSDKAQRFVLSRYFIAQSESRAVLRHGVARLWWTAHLSYDANRDNPYELTAVLLSTLDITQQLLERSLGRAPVIVKGFLEFLVRNRDPLLGGGEDARALIRHLAKYLNTYGGVCVLDSLREIEIIGALEAELQRRLEAAETSMVDIAQE